MSDLDRAAALGALDAAYQKVTAVITGRSEAELLRQALARPFRAGPGPG